MKYIGHLDTMRYFQKAIKRAEIDIAYSTGFSPHPIMSFALPLGVGVTSDGEYIDIQVNSLIPSKDAISLLNSVMADGFSVTEYVLLSDDSKKGMTLVGASDYEISINPEISFPLTKEQWLEAEEFINNSSSLEVMKESKKATKIVDIKPFIYSFKAIYDEDKVYNSKYIMRLGAGSKNNLKPDLLLSLIFNKYGLNFDKNMIHIHRNELMDENMIPLKDLGENVE